MPGRDPIGFFERSCSSRRVVRRRVHWNLIEYHRIAPDKFHTVGIIGSILGAIVVLIIMRFTGAERGHRRRYRRT